MKKYLYILFILFTFIKCDKDEENREYDFKRVNNDLIAGIWYHTFTIDSLVVVFEEDIMKEYMYDKNTKKLINRTDYGKYYLYQRIYNNGKIENTISISKPDSLYSSSIDYNLSNNTLSLYRGNNKVDLYKIE